MNEMWRKHKNPQNCGFLTKSHINLSGGPLVQNLVECKEMTPFMTEARC